MANPEHLELVRQGPKAINEWHKANPDTSLDLSHANLTDADLTHANLIYANLIYANLTRANLTRANLGCAVLCAANLTDARLRSTDLTEADLTEADLTRATLIGANLAHADLTDADLTLARCWDTHFADLDLTQPKGLDKIDHIGPSHIDTATLYKSKDNIPESFLRGAGVPQNLIDYLPSLTTKPFHFHSCFISYTEADDTFSKKLYDDLQAADVRCWRWREDARWGRTLRREIAEGIRLYDKLIVICSKDSLKAPAVLREIERALQKEDTLQAQGKDPDVLFPIRIDDYIFSKEFTHQTREDLHAKTIGDFTHPDDPQAYQDALQRLLKNLNPAT